MKEKRGENLARNLGILNSNDVKEWLSKLSDENLEDFEDKVNDFLSSQDEDDAIALVKKIKYPLAGQSVEDLFCDLRDFRFSEWPEGAQKKFFPVFREAGLVKESLDMNIDEKESQTGKPKIVKGKNTALSFDEFVKQAKKLQATSKEGKVNESSFSHWKSVYESAASYVAYSETDHLDEAEIALLNEWSGGLHTEEKDLMRIGDIVKKSVAKGHSIDQTALSLSKTMCKLIKDGPKAVRRARATKELKLDSLWQRYQQKYGKVEIDSKEKDKLLDLISAVFFQRALDLGHKADLTDEEIHDVRGQAKAYDLGIL